MTYADALPLLDAAIKAQDARPLWTLGDVHADLESGAAKLWLGERSAIVTVESDYQSTNERLIECWLAGGDIGEITGAVVNLEHYARRQGCTQAHITGRNGWVRALAPHGYAHYATVVRKLLK